MNKSEFLKHFKIGFMSRGYETFKQGANNIIVSVGFLGKCMNSTTSNYKVNIDGIIDGMGSKGIRMIKPKEYSSEELAGLEWPVHRFVEGNKILVPEEGHAYTDSNGNMFLRFQDYKYQHIGTGSSVDEESDRVTERDFAMMFKI